MAVKVINTEQLEQQIIGIINDIYYDLEKSCDKSGYRLNADTLADFVGDRMHDDSAEYRAMPYEERRALVLEISKKYV